ncbi:MAG: hypothetical protein IJ306_03830 [Oscillospiraceae bacterium]|nr:hypothetical protein [Oscillospiraceae bacterium]
MDMRISGSGSIGAGEYDDVRISGSGRSEGLIRCQSFHASGAYHGESVECIEEFHVSGSGKNSGDVSAGSFGVSGAYKCEGSVTVKNDAHISGSFGCGKNLKAGELGISGAVKVGGDIEAEHAVIRGGLDCGGLVNAEVLEIYIGQHNGWLKAGSIGGSKITVESTGSTHHPGLIEKLFGWNSGNVKLEVEDSIEGDEIHLEKTVAKSVIGRNVVIGEGCKIDLVQYTEEVVISPDAQVGSCEKV